MEPCLGFVTRTVLITQACLATAEQRLCSIMASSTFLLPHWQVSLGTGKNLEGDTGGQLTQGIFHAIPYCSATEAKEEVCQVGYLLRN